MHDQPAAVKGVSDFFARTECVHYTSQFSPYHVNFSNSTEVSSGDVVITDHHERGWDLAPNNDVRFSICD